MYLNFVNFVLILLLFSLIINSINVLGNRSFYVDYEKNEFIKDGEVFRYVSGSLQYYHVPRAYWKDRIKKMKAAGLNAITTYIEWSFHEPYSGVYTFEGQADFEHFLTIAKHENLLVLLRPGPFINNERDLGGFPYWLLKEKPRIKLRSSDPNYKKFVQRWFSVLMPKIVPYLYGNGGNVIMIQVENEYGSNNLGGCDKEYMLWLRDLILHYVDVKAQLFTNDLCNLSNVECGHISNVYSTVDFGPDINVSTCFNNVRQVQTGGPFTNTEFYVGWVTYWNGPRPDKTIEETLNMLEFLFAVNASVNFYLFHGGTNFGFTSGASAKSYNNYTYQPVLTSYEFMAPLDEAGDPTEKYYAIKRFLKKANFPTSVSPKRALKGSYGTVYLLPVVSLLDHVSRRHKTVVNDVPLCFEDMDFNQGLVLYETKLPSFGRPEKLPLVINSLSDRGIIFLDDKKLGIMTRTFKNTTMNLLVSGNNHKLRILVENQGRISDGKCLEDRKGILSDVTLGKYILGPWAMTGYPLNETAWLDSLKIRSNVEPPAFYRGVFVIPQNSTHTKPLDTFLDTSGWTKGVAFINGINIGRYWPAVGPQITLYVPGPYLVYGVNTIVMVELERAPDDFSVKFVDKSKLDY